MKNFKEKISNIKAFAFDCDGVLTDGSLLVAETGELLRSYNSKDGHAITEALRLGYPIAIISGGTGEAMRKRFEKLGIKDVFLLSKDKVEDINEFAKKHDLSLEEILYMGDDIPDIKTMKAVGVSVAPKDAILDVKAVATHTSSFNGGQGCVRDVIEQVLKARGDWRWE